MCVHVHVCMCMCACVCVCMQACLCGCACVCACIRAYVSELGACDLYHYICICIKHFYLYQHKSGTVLFSPFLEGEEEEGRRVIKI